MVNRSQRFVHVLLYLYLFDPCVTKEHFLDPLLGIYTQLRLINVFLDEFIKNY